jgi:hypothetical protein
MAGGRTEQRVAFAAAARPPLPCAGACRGRRGAGGFARPRARGRGSLFRGGAPPATKGARRRSAVGWLAARRRVAGAA